MKINLPYNTDINLGTIFSSGLGTTGNSLMNNVIKGDSLFKGLDVNKGNSIAGNTAGLASNCVGKGISSLGGNDKLSRDIG